jgi:hypothetical protein
LPQVVGLFGRLLFCSTLRRRSSASRALRPPRPPAKRVVKTIALSVKVEAGTPKRATVARKRSRTIGPVTGWWAVTSRASRRWSTRPGQDLGAGGGFVVGAGERVVGEVGLPALVRQLCLEPLVGGLGALGGLWGDQPEPGQVAADGGHRDVGAVVVGEVPGDGVRPGVQTRGGERAAEFGDQRDGCQGDRRRAGLGAA